MADWGWMLGLSIGAALVFIAGIVVLVRLLTR